MEMAESFPLKVLGEITLTIALCLPPLCLCCHTTIGCSGSENYTFGRYNMEIGWAKAPFSGTTKEIRRESVLQTSSLNCEHYLWLPHLVCTDYFGDSSQPHRPSVVWLFGALSRNYILHNAHAWNHFPSTALAITPTFWCLIPELYEDRKDVEKSYI